MSKPPAGQLLSPDLHEIGTRLVDLMNQTGFLYRFPGVAGVTLACLSQHLEPLDGLLKSIQARRTRLGESQSSTGFTVGAYTRPDPLSAAYDYAVAAHRAFLNQLEIAAESALHESDRAALSNVIAGNESPKEILAHREIIDSIGERAAAEAAGRFQLINDEDWQGLRMVLFFFLLELERSAA